jgi:hypothetical protein
MLAFYLLLSFAPQWLEELAKLPALMAHYQTHLQEDPGTTFSAFLSQHYGKDYAQHRHQHDHSKLPGKAKHHDSCVHLSMPGGLVLPYNLELAVKLAWEEPLHSSVFTQDQVLHSAYLSCIWQPPRA